MFSKITPKKLRKKLLLKYFYQFFFSPFVLGTFISITMFLILLIFWGEDTIYRFFVNEPCYILGYVLALMGSVVNIFSLFTLVKLMADSDKNLIQKEIKITTVFPAIELLGLRDSKRFFIDTLSRKENVEAFLFTKENGKRRLYRAFLNEDWGDIGKFDSLMKKDAPVKITYFKHSKIIVHMEEICVQDNH